MRLILVKTCQAVPFQPRAPKPAIPGQQRQSDAACRVGPDRLGSPPTTGPPNTCLRRIGPMTPRSLVAVACSTLSLVSLAACDPPGGGTPTPTPSAAGSPTANCALATGTPNLTVTCTVTATPANVTFD